MKHFPTISSLLALLAFAAGTVGAAETPAAAPVAKVDTQTSANATPRADAKVDAQEARRELDGMREQMRELSKKMAEMSARLGDLGPRNYAYQYIGDRDRGMIGVVLSKDDRGARVDAVTPGGPADKAGIKNGDVIVKVRGENLGESGDASPKILNEKLRNLKTGQEVTLTLQRDSKNIDVKIKAERREPFNFAFSFDNADIERVRADAERAAQDAQMSREQAAQIREQVREATRLATEQGRLAAEQGREVAEQAREIANQARHQASANRIYYSTPWWGLNLASLNPDLGSYFGADHGALVLSADAETTKTLKSGDVLLAIDGKKIARPEDAMRLLREGEEGREVKVEVLRAHKTQTLSMKAPEFKSLFVPAPPAPPAPPVPLKPLAPLKPPTPPAAPAPPAPPTPPAPVTPVVLAPAITGAIAGS